MADYDGHRKRLREKFLNNGFAGFLDYEIIELLLTIGVPRKDCKPIAKVLITKYKTASGVINASDIDLVKTRGLGQSNIFGIKLARELGLLSGKNDLDSARTGFIDIEKAANLLMKEIGYEKKEIFKVICINTKGAVISDTVSIGTLDMSIVEPREVFKIALDNNAAGIVIAHNHPSGDTAPSEDDIYTTRKLAESGKILGIDVLDHLIVSNSEYTKLSEKGYL